MGFPLANGLARIEIWLDVDIGYWPQAWSFFCRNQQEMRDANRVPFDELTSNYLEAVPFLNGTGCRRVSWLSANHAFDDFLNFLPWLIWISLSHQGGQLSLKTSGFHLYIDCLNGEFCRGCRLEIIVWMIAIKKEQWSRKRSRLFYESAFIVEDAAWSVCSIELLLQRWCACDCGVRGGSTQT